MGKVSEKADRRQRRLERLLETRTLEPWERYRALDDALGHLRDVSDMGDQKARFALIIMGALNAGNVVILARSGLTSGQASAILVTYAAVYSVAALYLFIQAIESLRPRAVMDASVDEMAGRATGMAGLRFMGNMVRMGPEEYDLAWRGLRIGELSRELALHVQIMARINVMKFRAISRLYRGLEVMTFLTAGLIAYRGFGG